MVKFNITEVYIMIEKFNCNVEPKKVFEFFSLISAIPRGSGHMEKISEFCCEFACERGLDYFSDDTLNVIIYKKGSQGRENEKPVILQGHLDMVWEKKSDCAIDFENEGITLLSDGEYVFADGTTLGGDDGIAVAYCLAVLDSDDISHPPLEVVFTVDEETGMDGAQAIDASRISGKRMINIDSEDEGTLWIGCAGGARFDTGIDFNPVSSGPTCCEIVVSGLHGGHSGTEIHKGYANANVVMGRVLKEISGSVDFCLVSINGGTMDNAITRECRSKIAISSESEALFKVINRLNSSLRKEFSETDPDFSLRVVSCKNEKNCLSKKDTERVIGMLCSLPNGVVSMSKSVEGLVQTSLNLGSLKTVDNKISFVYLVRSCDNSEKAALIERLETIALGYDARYRVHSDYPAWEIREESELQRIFADTYEKMFGKKMTVTAIHAGLECGLFCGKIDGLDCVSFGPDIFDIHTPDEKLSIGSCARMWEYLLAVLKNL